MSLVTLTDIVFSLVHNSLEILSLLKIAPIMVTLAFDLSSD